MPTVTWTNDHPLAPDASFPSVTLPSGMIWEAHHSCGPNTDWLDGHFVGVEGSVLDIVAIEAPDEAFAHDSFDLPALRIRAREAWDAGEVIYLDIGALVVPVADLTEGDIIAEAISRFRP